MKRGASDLHLVVGRPPTLRLHGHLRELQTKVLEPEDTMALLKAITPERIQQEFEEEGSGDFGFAYGDAARFRVAIFKQKGFASMVLRKIPNKIMSFEDIGLPAMAEQICRRPRGIFLVTGPDRQRQDDDAGDHDRLHQHQLRSAHHHDGRPDRVLPQP